MVDGFLEASTIDFTVSFGGDAEFANGFHALIPSSQWRRLRLLTTGRACCMQLSTQDGGNAELEGIAPPEGCLFILNFAHWTEPSLDLGTTIAVSQYEVVEPDEDGQSLRPMSSFPFACPS